MILQLTTGFCDTDDPVLSSEFITHTVLMALASVKPIKFLGINTNKQDKYFESISILPDVSIEQCGFMTQTEAQQERTHWINVLWELAHHPATNLQTLLYIAEVLPFRVLDNPYLPMILPFDTLGDLTIQQITKGYHKLMFAELSRQTESHRWLMQWFLWQQNAAFATPYEQGLARFARYYTLEPWPKTEDDLYMTDEYHLIYAVNRRMYRGYFLHLFQHQRDQHVSIHRLTLNDRGHFVGFPVIDWKNPTVTYGRDRAIS